MSSQKKIAVLIPEYPGQTHSFFWREIEALKERHGIDAQIISTRLAPRPVYHDWVEKAHAIQLYPISKARLIALAPALLMALPRLMSSPDVRRILKQPKAWGFVLMALQLAHLCRLHGLSHMHVHSCANFALIAALCHRISGIPYSLVLHGPLDDYGNEQPFKWDGAAFTFIITEKLLAEVKAVMPQVIAKSTIVPMGVDTDMFCPPEKPRPEHPDPFVWFCCARLNRVKGLDTLVEAAALLRARQPERAFHIRIAGEDEQGGTGYHLELADMITNAGLTGTVELMGAVTQEVVRRELNDADAFVLASLHEPLGVVYMEAMACELPVIGTDAGGVKELIMADENGILIPPKDAGALADAMTRLMDDPALRAALGRAARTRIVQDFSSRRSADALARALSHHA